MEALYQATLRLNASLVLPDVLDELVQAVRDIVVDLTSIRVFIQVEGRLIYGTAWWPGSTPGLVGI